MGIIKKMHYKSKLILCYLVLVSFPLILCLVLLYQSIVKPVRENAVSAIDQRLDQELNTINSKIEKIRNVSYLVSTNTVINKFFVPKFYGDLELIEILNNDISPLLSWLEAPVRRYPTTTFSQITPRFRKPSIFISTMTTAQSHGCRRWSIPFLTKAIIWSHAT